MEDNNNKNLLKKLLDRLQEDSWQLELLVSGFTIFGLFHALDAVSDAFQKALHFETMTKDIYQAAYIAINILIFNLIIHVILRSIWIGALGLRYISGEVNIEKLNYGERFTKYLTKKVGSFDKYIEKLEKLCSIIFAISFLLIFYFAAVLIVLHFINSIAYLEPEDAPMYIQIFTSAIQILLLLGALLTFIDYLTQGLLKRNKWVAAVYFPFYWLFSYLTLSFIYRPLYYNLIDNKFGRQISFFLLPVYLSVLFIANLYREESKFINLNSVTSNSIRSNSRNYEDLIKKDDLFISSLCIQSKVIRDPYVKVKIPVMNAIEKHIVEFNKDIAPHAEKNIYKSHMNINGKGINSTFTGDIDSLHQEFLNTYKKIYSFKIDTTLYNPELIIAKENNGINNSICIETYIGIKDLNEGKHTLIYSRLKHPETDSTITIKEIPFWYFKD